LHFQTKTTIDTLDYSGEDWNGGSKVVMACRGEKIRVLHSEIKISYDHPDIKNMSLILPGVLGITIQPFTTYASADKEISALTSILRNQDLSGYPLIVLSDDSAFTAATINNFVWVTFTRSNPSHDIYGLDSFTKHKHWGCNGSLIIDARKKPHHAPELVVDKEIQNSVTKMLTF